ncbi:MAG: Gfo/Idh/MocA family protein [Flavipsychrobacter sp.]
MLKVGVFGAGHLGKIHMQQWKEIPNVELVGFFDPDDANAASAIEQYNVTRYDTADALIQACQALDIVSTTSTHYDIAKKCLLNSRHLFIEKPLANTLEQGRELVKLVKEANINCQVGHVERYNPAYLALAEES